MAINMADRRVRRTRRLLKQGLTELLKEKQFSDISARDITERMDLNRATFYLHYKSTYELLQDVEEDMLAEAQKMIDAFKPEDGDRSMRSLFEPILDFVVENRSICDALFVNNASSDFTGRVVDFIYKNGSILVKKRNPDVDEEILEYELSYNSYGLLGLIRRWFETGMKLPKEQLVSMGDNLLQNGEQNISSVKGA